MPKQLNVQINQFDKGFNTEASALNFPANTAIDESNFVISPSGTRERRLGLDFEKGFIMKATGLTKAEIDKRNIQYHNWDNAMNLPTQHIGVVSLGNRLFFFDMLSEVPSASPLNKGKAIDLPMFGEGLIHSTFINGFLVLTCTSFEYPIYLEYDSESDEVVYHQIVLKIRDLQGVDDGLELRQRPTTLSLEHKYNLINQGWTDLIETIPDGTSEIQYIQAGRGIGGDSGNATWGGVTFYVDEHAPGNGIDWVAAALNNKIFEGCNFMATAEVVGGRCLITFDPRDGARPQYDFTAGRCLWNDCAISSGRIQSGTTTPYSDVHSYLKSKLGTYASNCDIVSLGLVPSSDSLYYNKFDIDTFQKNTGYLNLGEAPKGHIIIDAKKRSSSRDAIVPGVASDYDTGSVSVCCGHAGRVFYAGVQGETVNPDIRTISSHSLVYFTQIVTDKTKLERCYQENDPTDQRQFELAAGDGGTIFIPGCVNIVALRSFGTSVLVFSEKGLWEITGGDLPFAATGYSVNKVTQVACISPQSILEVDDSIIFWSREGIYVLSRNQYGHIVTENITRGTIQNFFNEIPDAIKRGVRGYFDVVKNQARWLFTKQELVVASDSRPAWPLCVCGGEEEEVIPPQDWSLPAFVVSGNAKQGFTEFNGGFLITNLSITHQATGLCGAVYINSEGEPSVVSLGTGYNYSSAVAYLGGRKLLIARNMTNAQETTNYSLSVIEYDEETGLFNTLNTQNIYSQLTSTGETQIQTDSSTMMLTEDGKILLSYEKRPSNKTSISLIDWDGSDATSATVLTTISTGTRIGPASRIELWETGGATYFQPVGAYNSWAILGRTGNSLSTIWISNNRTTYMPTGLRGTRSDGGWTKLKGDNDWFYGIGNASVSGLAALDIFIWRFKHDPLGPNGIISDPNYAIQIATSLPGGDRVYACGVSLFPNDKHKMLVVATNASKVSPYLYYIVVDNNGRSLYDTPQWKKVSSKAATSIVTPPDRYDYPTPKDISIEWIGGSAYVFHALGGSNYPGAQINLSRFTPEE